MTILNIHLYQYALVAWGGRQAGRRPPTKLAEILEVHKGSQYVRVRFWLGNRWSKTPRNVHESEIYRVWRICPSQPDIAAARRELPKLPDTVHIPRRGAA